MILTDYDVSSPMTDHSIFKQESDYYPSSPTINVSPHRFSSPSLRLHMPAQHYPVDDEFLSARSINMSDAEHGRLKSHDLEDQLSPLSMSVSPMSDDQDLHHNPGHYYLPSPDMEDALLPRLMDATGIDYGHDLHRDSYSESTPRDSHFTMSDDNINASSNSQFPHNQNAPSPYSSPESQYDSPQYGRRATKPIPPPLQLPQYSNINHSAMSASTSPRSHHHHHPGPMSAPAYVSFDPYREDQPDLDFDPNYSPYTPQFRHSRITLPRINTPNSTSRRLSTPYEKPQGPITWSFVQEDPSQQPLEIPATIDPKSGLAIIDGCEISPDDDDDATFVLGVGAKFKCECGKLFEKLGNLKAHARLHRAERNHICEVCQRAFMRRQDLRRHRALHMASFKPWECENCHTTFTRSDALHRHLKARRCM